MTERNAAADGLTTALAEIAEANTSLATLAREQRKAIGMMATEAVAGITAQQREAGRALADAELARRKHATALAYALGLPESAHLDGLARQVMAKLNHAGLYAATGSLTSGQSPRGVDLVS